MPANDHQDARVRLAGVQAAMVQAARLAQRDPAAVKLVAISKTHPIEAIEPLIAAGQRCFGENRVQEAQEKWPRLRERHADLELHLVGRLQSNKADDAVKLFDAIHSIDRPSVIAAVAKAMDRQDRRPDCFLQVNIGEESQKGGCPIADVPRLLSAMRKARLPLVGLMCVPPAEVEAAPYFALLAKIAKEEGVAGLSMGMSGDFETAVMLGATHIRVGTALFGTRG